MSHLSAAIYSRKSTDICIRGLTNAFGVFQTYYQHKFPNEKPAVISLIGCIQPFVLIFFGFLAGPLWDAGYCQSLMLVGTCITVFGYMMVSICDKYWQVMLAQGVLTGFGSCLLYLPAIAIIPQYFNQKKALANGIAASGSGLGELGSCQAWCTMPLTIPCRRRHLPNRISAAT